jgi:hypothetical protein
MENEPEARSTSSIALSTPFSQRIEILESRVSGMLNDPLKAGGRFRKRINSNGWIGTNPGLPGGCGRTLSTRPVDPRLRQAG